MYYLVYVNIVHQLDFFLYFYQVIYVFLFFNDLFQFNIIGKPIIKIFIIWQII